MKKQISAQIVADSVNVQGNRITTFILTYPRMIHAEVMTHRMFSRNAASSRAIPFKKMIKSVMDDPFIPIAWQKDHKGMQGNEYITDRITLENCIGSWKAASIAAIAWAKTLSEELEVTKQICNRLLEPFMWYTCLVTATEYDNFFELRAPKYYSEDTKKTYKSKKDYIEDHKLDFSPYNNIQWLEVSKSGAEIHIQALAEAMWDARNESEPRKLEVGEWHIPFGDQMDNEMLYFISQGGDHQTDEELAETFILNKLKIAVARCARLSYMTFDGEIDYNKDIVLFQQLLESKHASPFEHCARAMDKDEYTSFIKGKGMAGYIGEPLGFKKENLGWCNNFRGFIPYRYLIENK